MIVNYLILLIVTLNLGFSVYFYYRKPFVKNVTIRYLPEKTNITWDKQIAQDVYYAKEDEPLPKGGFIAPNTIEFVLEKKGNNLSIDDLLEE